MNGIGSVGNTASRRAVFDRFTQLGFDFVSLCHPMAIISESADVGAGGVVLRDVEQKTVLRNQSHDGKLNTTNL